MIVESIPPPLPSGLRHSSLHDIPLASRKMQLITPARAGEGKRKPLKNYLSAELTGRVEP